VIFLPEMSLHVPLLLFPLYRALTQHVGPRYEFEFNGHLLFTRLLCKGEQTLMRPRPSVSEMRLAANVQKILLPMMLRLRFRLL